MMTIKIVAVLKTTLLPVVFYLLKISSLSKTLKLSNL